MVEFDACNELAVIKTLDDSRTSPKSARTKTVEVA